MHIPVCTLVHGKCEACLPGTWTQTEERMQRRNKKRRRRERKERGRRESRGRGRGERLAPHACLDFSLLARLSGLPCV